MKNVFRAALLAGAAVALTSCATIVNGTKQRVTVSSEPSGAEVLVDGISMGQTPASLCLKRKDAHVITVKKEGFAPQTMKVENEMSGWIFGNILFGWIPGAAVDVIFGGGYKLEPEAVITTLTPAAKQ